MYHVPTEASGVSSRHIITRRFVGGNIVASKKTSYADIVSAEHLPEIVRELMEEQHKEMLRNLMAGAFDNLESGAVPKPYEIGQLGAMKPGPAAPASEAPANVPPAMPKASPRA